METGLNLSAVETEKKGRPETTQHVLNIITDVLDSQDAKGRMKYGTTIDEAKDSDYNWLLMALEEFADCVKYQQKEIFRLKAQTEKDHKTKTQLIGEIAKLSAEIKEFKTIWE